MVATVHLVCGSTGSGKTTFAAGLAKERAAVLFSIDDWMVGMFGDDAPAAMSPAWLAPRLGRCEQRIGQVVSQIGSLGVSSVLDLGFQKAEQRARWADMARGANLSVKVHHLDVSADERWRRVEIRNRVQGESYHLTVTRPMFDYIETTWQPPSQAEINKLESRDGLG